jgi:hypothetical protein
MTYEIEPGPGDGRAPARGGRVQARTHGPHDHVWLQQLAPKAADLAATRATGHILQRLKDHMFCNGLCSALTRVA